MKNFGLTIITLNFIINFDYLLELIEMFHLIDFNLKDYYYYD